MVKRTPQTPAAGRPTTGGPLVYAVGDIHGRADLLGILLRQILADATEATGGGRPMIVFLGDYIDRGPDSRGVVDLVLSTGENPAVEVRALKGNHEQSLLRFLEEPAFGQTWIEHGAGATLWSYGVRPPQYRLDDQAWAKARDALAGAIPLEHLRFYESLELMLTVGDYAFVHAGVRRGVSLAEQSEQDLLWIRRPFIEAEGPFEKTIVHGHTPGQEPELMRHRLGIDTGAYATGVLTAIRLQDETLQLMQARLG